MCSFSPSGLHVHRIHRSYDTLQASGRLLLDHTSLFTFHLSTVMFRKAFATRGTPTPVHLSMTSLVELGPSCFAAALREKTKTKISLAHLTLSSFDFHFSPYHHVPARPSLPVGTYLHTLTSVSVASLNGPQAPPRSPRNSEKTMVFPEYARCAQLPG